MELLDQSQQRSVSDISFPRGTEEITIASEVDALETSLQGFTFEGQHLQFELKNLNSETDDCKKFEFVSKILVQTAKQVVASWSTKKIEREDAFSKIQTIRNVWNTYALDKNKEIDKLLATYKDQPNAKEISGKMNQLRKFFKTKTMEGQQELNTFLAAVGDNNIKLAMES